MSTSYVQRANRLIDSYGMRAPDKAPDYLVAHVRRLLAERIALDAGDTIVYGNGTKAKVINFPKLNGVPGVQLEDPNAIFASDTFKTRESIDAMTALGVWSIERGIQSET